MLSMIDRVKMKRATNAATGDVQVFLERLLIEVVAANYRHFLTEKIEILNDGNSNADFSCWPPLFANERQVSGIFASALNTMCPSTIPEHKIQRRLERNEDSDELTGTSGRVDFLSYFGRRSIGLELKGASISTTAGGDYVVLKNLWDKVVAQSKEAHTYMRQKECRADYPDGTGVGLMVIRVTRQARKFTEMSTFQNELSRHAESISQTVEDVKKKLKPDFLAQYIPPNEMQAILKKNSYKIFPCILFAATVHGKADSLLT